MALNLWGIYPDEIEKSETIFENALKHEKFDDEIDDLYDEANEYFEEILNCSDLSCTSITNLIIDSLFRVAQRYIEEKHPKKKCDYYVNGWDSHFYINNKEIYA